MMTTTPRHVMLIGLRACGKSMLATSLATELGIGSVDLDDRTRARLGSSDVREAFRVHGEDRFRAAETEALAEALREAPQVIALGGGTPTAPGAAELIANARTNHRAFVVFLDLPLQVLASRLHQDAGDRPSLTGLGVVEEIERLAFVRRPLYAALADLVLTEPLDRDTLATRIGACVRSS
jgi:shikimate kinase